MENEKLTVLQIAEQCGCSRQWVYRLAKRLGRLPTVSEVKERKGKYGRPSKYGGVVRNND